MKNCKALSPENGALEPAKRVKYSFGMVLGENEFRQEQEHFLWKHRVSNLLLHGYGTVCGLEITIPPDTREMDEIQVTAGAAIDPAGRWVRVIEDQCAHLNDWLARQQGEVSPDLASGANSVYLRACYAEEQTDQVPVPGQPCATDENDLMAPSRVLETACVEFSWGPPVQPGEDHTRLFGELLARVEIVGDVAPPDDGERLMDLVGTLRQTASSPELSSPPDDRIRLYESTACETLRRALTLWITSIRPDVGGSGTGCDPAAREKACVLLGRLDFDMGADHKVVPGSVSLDQADRPLLLPTRLMQEWISCGIAGRSPGGEAHDHDDVYAPLGHQHALGELSDVNTAGQAANQVLTYNGTQWQPQVVPAPLLGLDALTDVDTTGQTANQVLTYNGTQWQPQTIPVLSLGLDALTDVDTTGQTANQVLTYNGTQWQPQAIPVLSLGLNRLTDVNTTGQTENQVLTFTSSGWRPRAVPAPLLGLNALTDVDTTGQTADQVLTFTSSGWRPRAVSPSDHDHDDGYVVADGGAYAIVAAGFLRADGDAISSYNGLRANSIANFEYTLMFRGIENYDRTEMRNLIVKGTPFIDQDTRKLPLSNAFSFQVVDLQPNKYIVVRVWNPSPRGANGDPIGEPNQSGLIGFMVEISFIGKPPHTG